jgi:hypothetical protein
MRGAAAADTGPARRVGPVTVALAALVLWLPIGCGPRDGRASDAPPSVGDASASGAASSDCASLGTWRHEHPTYQSEITICVEPSGARRVRQVFQDGSTYETVLTPVVGDGGDRYLRDPAASDYYEILPDGRLVLGDDEGVIAAVDPAP